VFLSHRSDLSGKRLDTTVRLASSTKVLVRFSGGSSSSEKESVGSSRGSEGKLIESEAFTPGSEDSSTCGFSETKSTDRELRVLQVSDVISDGSNNDGGFSLFSLDEPSDSSERDW